MIVGRHNHGISQSSTRAPPAQAKVFRTVFLRLSRLGGVEWGRIEPCVKRARAVNITTTRTNVEADCYYSSTAVSKKNSPQKKTKKNQKKKTCRHDGRGGRIRILPPPLVTAAAAADTAAASAPDWHPVRFHQSTPTRRHETETVRSAAREAIIDESNDDDAAHHANDALGRRLHHVRGGNGNYGIGPGAARDVEAEAEAEVEAEEERGGAGPGR